MKRLLAVAVSLMTLVSSGCPGDPGAPLRYEVILSIQGQSAVSARLFPGAPVKSAELARIEAAGTKPTVLWKAQAASEASYLPAEQAITLGQLPPGWTESVPLTASFEPGKRYSFTLTGSDDVSAFATHEFSTAPITIPELRLFQFGGQVSVWLSPELPATQVVLSRAGTALWTAVFADASGARFPSDGFLVGSAPLSWDAPLYPLNANLADGQTYTVSVTVPASATGGSADSVLSGDFIYRGGLLDEITPLEIAPYTYSAGQYRPMYPAAFIHEYNGRIVSFLNHETQAAPNRVGFTPFSDLNTSDRTHFLAPTPGFGSSATPATGVFSKLTNTFMLSQPLAIGEGAMALAQISDVGGIGIVVQESVEPKLFYAGLNPFMPKHLITEGWTPVGTAPAITGLTSALTPVPLSLIRRTVGLSQNAARPYVAAAVDLAAHTAHVSYFNTSAAWSSLPTTGLLPSGGNIMSISIEGANNKLYACTTSVTNGKGRVTLSQYSAATLTWTALDSAETNITVADGTMCRMVSDGEVLYVVAASNAAPLKLWIRKLSAQTSAPVTVDFDVQKVFPVPTQDQNSGPFTIDSNPVVVDAALVHGDLLVALQGKPALGGSTPNNGDYLTLAAYTAQGWSRRLVGLANFSSYFGTNTARARAIRISRDGMALWLTVTAELLTDSVTSFNAMSFKLAPGAQY